MSKCYGTNAADYRALSAAIHAIIRRMTAAFRRVHAQRLKDGQDADGHSSPRSERVLVVEPLGLVGPADLPLGIPYLDPPHDLRLLNDGTDASTRNTIAAVVEEHR